MMQLLLGSFRVYRMFRAGLVIVGALWRYLWLRWRAHLPLVKPTQASWDRAHRKTGRAINRLATNLGGAFVKLGQVLAARADALPATLIEPMRGLHDRVPPRPFAKLRHHVERELERPLAEVFADVDETPLAAASLAQVHRGTLNSGEAVAIKIQYPEARKLFPVDFGSLRRAVRVVRWLNRKLDLRPLVDELAEFVCLELDFVREAQSTERARAAFGDVSYLRIPRVHRELSTGRILVLEFLEGTAITRLDDLDWLGVDRRRTAETIARIYCEMIFVHGFFQGDPHPGNLLVDPNGTTIVVLDFGLAKELPAGFADGAALMLVKAFAGDLDGAVEAAHSIGFEIAGDRAAFGDLLKLLMGNRTDVSADAFSTLSATNLRKVPTHFALVGRTFVLLNGISHLLVPGERVIPQAVLRILGPRLTAMVRAPTREPVIPSSS